MFLAEFIKELREQLQQLESEKAMTMELANAGAIDLEAAMMMTKTRLKDGVPLPSVRLNNARVLTVIEIQEGDEF